MFVVNVKNQKKNKKSYIQKKNIKYSYFLQ